MTCGAVRVVVLSDSHAPRRWRRLPPELAEPLRTADLVLHAGDVCEPTVLDELAAFAPVRVVLGNNDGPDVAARGATPTLELDVAGVRVAMVHDSGASAGRGRRMHRLFPQADLVVFGHSHIPWHSTEQVDGHRFVLLNPGSVTDPRRQPLGSFAVLDLQDDRIGTPVLHDVARRTRADWDLLG